MTTKANKREFFQYFSKNLIRGFVYLLILIGALVFFKSFFHDQYDLIKHWVSDSYLWMTLIFFISETIVGILPPELFMAWSIDDGVYYYTLIVVVMGCVSTFSGWINYRVGIAISDREFIVNLFKKRLRMKKYQQRYEKYGSGLIIVSALTPLPFALISLLTGTLNYPQKKYLTFASFRLLRFIVFGILVWNFGDVL